MPFKNRSALKESQEFEFIKKNFCGIVYLHSDLSSISRLSRDCITYVCGEIPYNLDYGLKINVIKELSSYLDDQITKNVGIKKSCFNEISISEVPINIYNVGVYFRNFFPDKNYFNSITSEHTFQELTESNKLGKAYRKGIYMTNVNEIEESTSFNLLRCSTNFKGPSDNFRATDNEIIKKVNNAANNLFKEKVEFNHVLAQIYYNVLNENEKEKKARIKSHSDKTKDMPKNALMAFCTFYENMDEFKKSDEDNFDYVYKNTSVLTKLRFRLKSTTDDNYNTLEKDFSITLYPNSVFLMSLETNRLYTHEIVPSSLPIDKIPLRMGYVIRCSNIKAYYKDDNVPCLDDSVASRLGNVYIRNEDDFVKMEKITVENMKMLKELYAKENLTDELVNYPEIYFSMNEGDYLKPIK